MSSIGELRAYLKTCERSLAGSVRARNKIGEDVARAEIKRIETIIAEQATMPGEKWNEQ